MAPLRPPRDALEADGQPSVKFQHAERLVQEGLDLRIVSESDWLAFVGLDGRPEGHVDRIPDGIRLALEDVHVEVLGVTDAAKPGAQVHRRRRRATWTSAGLRSSRAKTAST